MEKVYAKYNAMAVASSRSDATPRKYVVRIARVNIAAIASNSEQVGDSGAEKEEEKDKEKNKNSDKDTTKKKENSKVSGEGRNESTSAVQSSAKPAASRSSSSSGDIINATSNSSSSSSGAAVGVGVRADALNLVGIWVPQQRIGEVLRSVLEKLNTPTPAITNNTSVKSSALVPPQVLLK